MADPPVILDEDGLLRRGSRWVAIPAGMALVVQLLLEQAGTAMPLEQVMAAYVAAGGTLNRKAVRTALARLRRRIEPLGLELETIGQRSVALRVGPQQ